MGLLKKRLIVFPERKPIEVRHGGIDLPPADIISCHPLFSPAWPGGGARMVNCIACSANIFSVSRSTPLSEATSPPTFSQSGMEVPDTPDDLGALVPAVGERHDHVVIDLGDG